MDHIVRAIIIAEEGSILSKTVGKVLKRYAVLYSWLNASEIETGSGIEKLGSNNLIFYIGNNLRNALFKNVFSSFSYSHFSGLFYLDDKYDAEIASLLAGYDRGEYRVLNSGDQLVTLESYAERYLKYFFTQTGDLQSLPTISSLQDQGEESDFFSKLILNKNPIFRSLGGLCQSLQIFTNYYLLVGEQSLDNSDSTTHWQAYTYTESTFRSFHNLNHQIIDEEYAQIKKQKSVDSEALSDLDGIMFGGMILSDEIVLDNALVYTREIISSLKFFAVFNLIPHKSSERERLIALTDGLVSIFFESLTATMVEESQRKHHKRRDLLIQNSPLGVIEFDLGGRVILWNRSATNIFGYEQEEMLGIVPETIFTPESFGEVEEKWDTFFQVLEVPIMQLDHRHKDGSMLKCKWYNSIVTDEKGKVKGVYSLVEDVTAIDSMIQKLKESKKQLEQITNYFPGITFQFVAGPFMDWRVVFASKNVESILGYDLNEEDLFQTFVEGILPEYTEELITSIEDAVTNVKPWFFEGRFRKKNGEIVWLSCRSVPLNEEPDALLFNGILLDVTNLKVVENELLLARQKAEELSQLKSNLLSAISHEIRTPLHGIIGLSSILYEQDGLSEEGKEYLGEIKFSGKRLLDTLDAIFQISFLNNAKAKLNLQVIDLNEVVDQEVRYHLENAQKAQLFLCNRSEERVRVVTDVRFLRLVMQQLIGNALKYTQKGGVEIYVKRTHQMAEIEVKDTGIGISEEYFDFIFEEFRQISEGHDRLFEGIGLGLSIASKAISLIKGEISVHSEVGKGSSFTIKLPYFLEDTESN